MIRKTLRNEKGLLTLDFVFASVLIFGLSSVIFSFGMTLSVAEVVQYISYSSARNYNLAHLNEQKQKERAEFKFQQLVTNPIFRSMIDYGWFEVGQIQINDFNEDFEPEPGFDNFYGARIPFSAPILYKRIPMVGTTGPDPDAFQANVQAFLSREPTFEECQEFIRGRRQAFKGYFDQVQLNEMHITMDNGC